MLWMDGDELIIGLDGGQYHRQIDNGGALYRLEWKRFGPLGLFSRFRQGNHIGLLFFFEEINYSGFYGSMESNVSYSI